MELMIKRIVAFILIVLIGIILLRVKPEIKKPEAITVPTRVIENPKEYLIAKISPENLILVNNTENKYGFSQIINDYNCQKAVNGGFYQEDNKPLGWMIIDGKQIQKVKSSQMFNGFVYIKNKRLDISFTNDDEAIYGHQSGPILINQGKPVSLQVANDKPTRRSVIAIDQDNNTYILMILNSLMQELPEKVSVIAEIEKLSLNKAINLDGGTASAYYDGVNKISELIAVGSVWCMIN